MEGTPLVYLALSSVYSFKRSLKRVCLSANPLFAKDPQLPATVPGPDNLVLPVVREV